MDSERNEVYERIPWETLESKGGGDGQWWMFALAGAIVLGALAYSFMSSRPVSAPPPPTIPVSSTVAAQGAPVTVPSGTAAPAPVPEVGTRAVVAEADLYAIPPERLLDQAAAHAEWFVTEYVGIDGSEESRAALATLMPAGVPAPPPPESTRVFVEWVRAMSVEEVDQLAYRVTVLVRSLLSNGEEPYRRQAPFTATVDVSIAEDGPHVMMPPVLGAVTTEPLPLTLAPVPADVEAAAIAASGGSAVAGGVQSAAGGWLVVVTAPGPDGVPRPVTVPVP